MEWNKIDLFPSGHAGVEARWREDEGEEVYTFAFGGKRPLKSCEKVVINYRHRGDFVPFLPFWRKIYRHEMKIGKWMPFWKAHGPSTYYEAMETYGFR